MNSSDISSDTDDENDVAAFVSWKNRKYHSVVIPPPCDENGSLSLRKYLGLYEQYLSKKLVGKRKNVR